MIGIVNLPDGKQLKVDTDKDQCVKKRTLKGELFLHKSRSDSEYFYIRTKDNRFEWLNGEDAEKLIQEAKIAYELQDDDNSVLIISDKEEFSLKSGKYWTQGGASRELGISPETVRSQMSKYRLGIKVAGVNLLPEEDFTFLKNKSRSNKTE